MILFWILKEFLPLGHAFFPTFGFSWCFSIIAITFYFLSNSQRLPNFIHANPQKICFPCHSSQTVHCHRLQSCCSAWAYPHLVDPFSCFSSDGHRTVSWALRLPFLKYPPASHWIICRGQWCHISKQACYAMFWFCWVQGYYIIDIYTCVCYYSLISVLLCLFTYIISSYHLVELRTQY